MSEDPHGLTTSAGGERADSHAPKHMTDVHAGSIFRLIAVGADGSDGSRRALEWTAQLAQETGAHVLAVHVLTYTHELLQDITPDTMRTWRRELQHQLETEWVEPLAEHGVTHRCLIVESDSPAAGLLEVADRERVNAIVVGAKGQGGLAGRVLGGVSYRVTHRARQPVVVVPPDWSASETFAPDPSKETHGNPTAR